MHRRGVGGGGDFEARGGGVKRPGWVGGWVFRGVWSLTRVCLCVCPSFSFGELLKHPTAMKSLLSRDEFKTMTILPSFNKLIEDVNKGTVTDAAVRHLPQTVWIYYYMCIFRCLERTIRLMYFLSNGRTTEHTPGLSMAPPSLPSVSNPSPPSSCVQLPNLFSDALKEMMVTSKAIIEVAKDPSKVADAVSGVALSDSDAEADAYFAAQGGDETAFETVAKAVSKQLHPGGFSVREGGERGGDGRGEGKGRGMWRF